MTTVEKIEASKAWDTRFNLPTFPQFNNPFIYLAYMWLLVEQSGEKVPDAWELSLAEFGYQCNKNGTYTRWPDGTGGTFSHDEVMGASYLNHVVAADMINQLQKTDGLFDSDDERKNQFRFLFLMPLLKACAGYRVGIISQLQWSIHAMITAWKYKDGSESGILKMWLMIEKMKVYPLSRMACIMFGIIMQKKGITPRVAFKKYFNDMPDLAELACDEWMA